MLARWLQRQWFEQRRLSPALWLLLPLLLPLHGLYCIVSSRRRRQTTPQRLSVPVSVVGTITVGGAGKTPLTLWLAKALTVQGFRPGVVSRGYGRQGDAPAAVNPENSPKLVGDEPLLLARRSGVPVWVGQDRAAAGRALLAQHPQVDVLLCDDGLQHYRLGRDIELAVFDVRGAGNGWRLPLGPLREALSRLADVDAVICNGEVDVALPAGLPVFDMRLVPGVFYALGDPERRCTASELAGKRLHALAGIGDPKRFFRTLQALGLGFDEHPFADHHDYTAADLAFASDGVLLRTEKDAVKCTGLTTGEAWVLPVDAELTPALIELIVEKLRGRKAA